MAIKKRYQVSLPEQETEAVKTFLNKIGGNFSGFVSQIIKDFSDQIENKEGLFSKPIEEWTLKDVNEYRKSFNCNTRKRLKESKAERNEDTSSSKTAEV